MRSCDTCGSDRCKCPPTPAAEQMAGEARPEPSDAVEAILDYFERYGGGIIRREFDAKVIRRILAMCAATPTQTAAGSGELAQAIVDAANAEFQSAISEDQPSPPVFDFRVAEVIAIMRKYEAAASQPVERPKIDKAFAGMAHDQKYQREALNMVGGCGELPRMEQGVVDGDHPVTTPLLRNEHSPAATPPPAEREPRFRYFVKGIEISAEEGRKAWAEKRKGLAVYVDPPAAEVEGLEELAREIKKLWTGFTPRETGALREYMTVELLRRHLAPERQKDENSEHPFMQILHNAGEELKRKKRAERQKETK